MLRKSLSQDFESIFKDTENNISSIKRQLGDQGRTHFPPRSPVHSSNLAFGSTTHSSLNQLKSPLSYSPQNTSHTMLITSMFKRLEEQSKTIGLLEHMIQNQNKEIERIKDKQGDMKSSMRGSIGFDFQRKLESVERELRGEIESIRNSLRTSNQLGVDIAARNDFSRDIELQRRIIEDESDALKRELDSLKTRIGRIESDVNVSLRDSLDVNRKYGAIEKDVTNIISNQRSLKGVTERGENQLQNIKKELEEISSMICSVRKEDESAVNNKDLKQFSHITKADDNLSKDSTKVVDISDSPTNTMSLLANISDNNLSFNSFDFSDIEKIPTAKDSMEKCTVNDTKHTSLLDDDDDDILGFDSIDGDDDFFLEKHGSTSSLNNLKLSDEESVISDDVLTDDLL